MRNYRRFEFVENVHIIYDCGFGTVFHKSFIKYLRRRNTSIYVELNTNSVDMGFLLDVKYFSCLEIDYDLFKVLPKDLFKTIIELKIRNAKYGGDIIQDGLCSLQISCNECKLPIICDSLIFVTMENCGVSAISNDEREKRCKKYFKNKNIIYVKDSLTNITYYKRLHKLVTLYINSNIVRYKKWNNIDIKEFSVDTNKLKKLMNSNVVDCFIFDFI
jgi:hypothetical protein